MTTPASSGRRRITENERRATAGLTGRFSPTTAGLVLTAFKLGAPALGLSRGLVDFIDHLMKYTFPADWQGAWSPIVWPSNAELANSLGVEVSRIKELIRAALDHGLIRAIDHGTRKRFGKRGEGGRILYAYGFDLSPLAERMPAFQRAAAEHQARFAEAKSLRREISHLRVAVLGFAEFGAGHAVAGIDWPALALQVQDLAAPARSCRDPLRLAPIAATLRRLHAEADRALAASFPVENHPAEPENRPHNTTTNQLKIVETITNDARGPAIEGSGGGEDVPQPPAPPAPPAPERTEIGRAATTAKPAAGALRGFPMTPGVALQIAPAFRDVVPTARPSWADICEAAYIVRAHLGISQHAYGQACQILGRQEAATAIAIISAKAGAGQVRSPGGLLRYMTDAHVAGTLRLDRTLFGLVDKAGGLDLSQDRRSPSNPARVPPRRAAQAARA